MKLNKNRRIKPRAYAKMEMCRENDEHEKLYLSYLYQMTRCEHCDELDNENIMNI